MKKNNYMLIAMIYVICIFFGIMTLSLPSGAKLYPAFIIILLAALNTMLLIKTKSQQSDAKESSVFEGFQIKQFFFVFLSCIGYIILLNVVGFVISTIAYLLFCFIVFKIRKITGILTCIGFTVFIYLVFSIFLKVPLPTGLFF